jgi:histo-blood group ABO system transferase
MNPIFVITATNKYIDFVPKTLASLKKYCRFDFSTLVFSNRRNIENTFHKHCDHLPWPLITLLRYHRIWEHKEFFDDFSHIYLLDADCVAINPIDLSSIKGLLTAAIHPGNEKPFERNPISSAAIDNPINPEYYYGGFQGGETETFLKSCKILADMVNEDLRKNHIPVWHDESIWNKFCYRNGHLLNVLPQGFIVGESNIQAGQYKREDVKIMSLNKDNDYLRK